MHKTSKNIIKKSFKSAKMDIFENSLNSSKRVQIEFWIVEKIAIECLNRMLKKWWKFIKPIFWYRKYCCQGALFAWFWKSEKTDFCWYLLKERSYDLIDAWKKTYDPSWFSAEILFYLNKNWQKYWHFGLLHFFFDHTVLAKIYMYDMIFWVMTNDICPEE